MTTVPRPSPFAGIPLSDYLRDGAALVLLLVSFAMPWTSYAFATARVEVILITLLSVFSLSITYLARAGVFPASVTVNTVWMMRLLANVPYFLLVLVYLILDAATGANGTNGGVGTAAAFGLAGALLAAQPREAETRAFVAGAPIGELWYRIVLGFGAVALLTTFVGIILTLVGIARLTGSLGVFGYSPVFVVALILALLVGLAALALLYGNLARRSEVGRIIALAVGSSVLGIILIDVFARFTIVGQFVTLYSGGYVLIFIAALAGLASAPPVRIAMRATDPLRRWLDASAASLVAITVLAGYSALNAILSLTAGIPGYVGFGIGIIVCAVGMGLVAVVARSVLVANPTTSRTLVLLLVGLIVLLGIVFIVLQANSSGVDAAGLVLAFGLPVSVAVYLTAPAAVRAFYGVAAAPGTVHPTFVERLAHPGGAAPAFPAAPPAAPAAPTAVSQIALALDPATPAATLFQLAQDEPMLRQYIAANPSTYPDLLNWLATQGDPAIDAALRAR